MEVRETEEYHSWFSRLRDREAKARINVRLRKIELTGQIVGDIKTLGHVIELRFHFGPGYRVYAAKKDDTLLLLLVGGDKSTQERDILLAQHMAKEWRNEQ